MAIGHVVITDQVDPADLDAVLALPQTGASTS
jgi:hypothetical protein